METTERSLAEMIAGDPHPLGGEAPKLQAKAKRLLSAARTAEKWGDVCMADNSPPEMAARAEHIHDQLEEELSRVVWELEVYDAKVREKAIDRTRPEGRRVDDLEAVARASRLSDKLLEAYCVLSRAPADVFGVEGSEISPKTRYSLMGALLAALDAANAECERLSPPLPAGE